MRLLLVSILSLTLGALIIFTLRQVGLQQEYMMRKHAFLSDGPKVFSVLGDKNLANYPSLQNMIETKKILQNIGWSLPLYVEGDELVARIESKSIRLHDILSTFPNDFYFFQLMENKETINHFLNEQIKKFNIQDRILIFSPYRNVLSQFRQLRPQWLTALSTPEANLFLLLHKLKIETIAPFPADFMWLEKADKIWLQDLSTDELQRRNKFLFCDDTLQAPMCRAYTTDSPTTYSADQTSS